MMEKSKFTHKNISKYFLIIIFYSIEFLDDITPWCFESLCLCQQLFIYAFIFFFRKFLFIEILDFSLLRRKKIYIQYSIKMRVKLTPTLTLTTVCKKRARLCLSMTLESCVNSKYKHTLTHIFFFFCLLIFCSKH